MYNINTIIDIALTIASIQNSKPQTLNPFTLPTLSGFYGTLKDPGEAISDQGFLRGSPQDRLAGRPKEGPRVSGLGCRTLRNVGFRESRVSG